MVQSLGIDASNPVEVSQTYSQEGAIPFPFPLEDSLFWEEPDTEDEYEGEAYDNKKNGKSFFKSNIKNNKDDNKDYTTDKIGHHE